MNIGKNNRISQNLVGTQASLLQVYAGKAGKAEINLGIGQPGMMPDKELDVQITKVISERKTNHAAYTGAAGSEAVLGVVANVFRECGLQDISEKNVLVSHGAKLLLDITLRAICSRGDMVVWFSPGYTYEAMAEHNGLKAVSCETDENFSPKAEALKEIIQKEVTENNKIIIMLNNPVNPTGRVWSKKELQSVIDATGGKENVFFIADETYADLVFKENSFTSFGSFSEVAERTITIRSASKEMRIPGYRFGYAAGPEDIISAMKILLGDNVGCPNTLAQIIGIKGLADHKKYAKEQLPELLENKNLIVQWCQKNKFPMSSADGTFYAFIDFSKIIKKLNLLDAKGSADYLLSTCSVGIIPGQAFSSKNQNCEQYKNWARISYAGKKENIIEGLKRIIEA